MMPRVDGLQLLQKVKADPRFKDLPVLMISSMPPEEATVRSLGLGAADFIPKPFRVRELLARVKAHLRVGRELNQARAEARSRSEMMDIMQEVTASLKPEEIYQILVRRVAQGLNISRCSIVITGPEDDTGTVVAAFENPMLHNLPVDLQAAIPRSSAPWSSGDVVLVRDTRTDPLYTGVRQAVDDRGQAGGRPGRPSRSASRCARSRRASSFSARRPRTRRSTSRTSSFAEQVITAAVAALERAYDLESAVMGQEQMRHLAETDPLTNCFNRRALMEKLEQEMDRAARYATMLTGMMIDIDNFKQINDTHGHLVGDRVLKQLANLLKREQRSVDIVARYGGEEFVVLLARDDERRIAQLRRAHPPPRRDPRFRRGGPSRPGDDQRRDRLVSRTSASPTATRSCVWPTPISIGPRATAGTESAIEQPALSSLPIHLRGARPVLRQGRVAAGRGGARRAPPRRRATPTGMTPIRCR